MLVALGMFPRLFPFTLCPLRVAASLCRNRAPGHAATRHPAPGRSIPPRRHPPARARKGARSHSTQPTGAAFHPPAHARVHARPAPAGTTGTLARLPHARACAGARAPRRPLGPLRPGPPPSLRRREQCPTGHPGARDSNHGLPGLRAVRPKPLVAASTFFVFAIQIRGRRVVLVAPSAGRRGDPRGAEIGPMRKEGVQPPPTSIPAPGCAGRPFRPRTSEQVTPGRPKATGAAGVF